MGSTLRYKGYSTIIRYSAEDRVLHGKIEEIDDLVTFESKNSGQIEKEFQDAVDDYLAYCKAKRKTKHEDVKTREGGRYSLFCYNCRRWIPNTANYEMRKEGAYSHSHACSKLEDGSIKIYCEEGLTENEET